jgi:hypothetical protein
MKTYTFELTIHEGYDTWWKILKEKSGCDEVKMRIVRCLIEAGFNSTGEAGDYEIKLKRFEEHD